MSGKVAVITGGNSGIGFTLADRLLGDHTGIHICLACRNKGRAEKARLDLLEKHRNADISIVIMDTSVVKSVIEASETIRKKFSRLDYLFMNAGIMKVSSVNLSQIAAIFSSKGAKILSTGEGVLNHLDHVTNDGLQEVFATNLFGHFVMVRELEDKMGSPVPTQVIWTSSQNADSSFLDLNDIQHKHGKEPYGSSKYATDMLSVGLNRRLNHKGIYSVTVCPGLVLSNMTFGILSSWLWMLLLPFLYFMRLFVHNMNCSPYNGAEVLVWTTKQSLESLDPRTKYASNCNVFGQLSIGREKLSMKDEDIDSLYNQLEELYRRFKDTYGQKTRLSGHAANCQNVTPRHGAIETDM